MVHPFAMALELKASWCSHIDAVAEAQWNALVGTEAPFLRHAFLHGLENTGCLDPRWGWQAHHLLLKNAEDGELVAAMPCYRKDNSHGEFVFDFAWAQACMEAGLAYYPKLLCGVPYTPVTGPRMLISAAYPDTRIRKSLARVLVDHCAEQQFSGVHVNFHARGEESSLQAAGFMARRDWQFHWYNHGYADFAQFLARLRSAKRKKIRQERQQIGRYGLNFRCASGGQLTDADLRFAHACYQQTFMEKNNLPVLSLAFFFHLARALPQHLLLIIAEHRARPIACAVFLHSDTHLYGRYWGCMESLPGLHFETCYYQGIEFAIAHGIQVFEPGAQGLHKIARGFIPTMTRSHHYIQHPGARQAIARWLAAERAAQVRYHEDLCSHDPYRHGKCSQPGIAAPAGR